MAQAGDIIPGLLPLRTPTDTVSDAGIDQRRNRLARVKPAPTENARASGARCERRAAWHLRWRGWKIVSRNWIGGGGEIDLVACRWTTLLIVEVRKRPTTRAALLSVDRAKLDRTLAAAQAFVHAHGLHRYRLRFDIIAYDQAGCILRSTDILHSLLPARF